MDARDYLAIYLNDHLLGATGGLDLLRRSAAAQRGTPAGDVLARLAVEVEQDREALLAVARQLDVRVRPEKLLAGWALEKVGRLKPNGHLLSRSPLSSAVELEAMRLGVLGKQSAWRTLRSLADRYDALDPDELDALDARAGRQAEELEQLRAAAAAAVLNP